MAARLLDAKIAVALYNRTGSTAEVLAARWRGLATTAATPRECVREREVVLTMVSDAEALASLLEGPEGVLAGLAKGAVVVDMSTIGRKAALAVDRRIRAHGGRFVDAPVSGSVGPALRGELLALVGAHLRDLERARPVLDRLCRRIIHAGAVGQGQALKVVLNGVGAHHLVAFTSMLALGERAGLSRELLLDAFTSGAFSTPSYIGKKEKVRARDYTADFSLALALKDCSLNTELQQELGLPLPVVQAITDDIAAGVGAGLGELDLFALEKHYASSTSKAPR